MKKSNDTAKWATSHQRKATPSPNHSQMSDAESSGSSSEVISYKWSQVISISYMENDDGEVYNCSIDITELKKSKKEEDKADGDEEEWKFLFSPDHFDDDINIEQFQPQPFTAEEMQEYCLMSTIIR